MRSNEAGRTNGKGTTFSIEPALSERSESKGAAKSHIDRGLQPLRPALTENSSAAARPDQA
jgi:hypothetical protein